MPTHWESRSEPIPGYRLLERLGRGGFGEVWKAEAPGGLNKAVKFVFGSISEAKAHNHAEQELKALSRVKGIRHPFILSMERYDVVDGQLVIVMELADRNLEERLRDCRRMGLVGIPRTELLRYMSEAAEALDLMNLEHDLQHLDIKPQNLFLVGAHVKVADFGLVKDLEGCTASVTGGVTPVYAPPETFDGWVSRNSDQYSLAIVYQELLTGQRPFCGPSARQFMMQHLSSDPDLSPLPPSDRPTVQKALSKDPNQRFASCSEFVHMLEGKTTVVVDRDLSERPSERTFRESPVEPQDSAACLSTRLSVRSASRRTSVRPAPILDRTAAVDPERGLLAPTLVVGLGRTGIRTLERIRRKLSQRFGESTSWPAIRMLGIDTDADVLRELARTESVGAELGDQLLVCKFRKPSQYFKTWESLTHLSKWLNPNSLFQITASGTTNGHRPLGRLALIENYRRILSRLRTELEQLTAPLSMEAAVHSTGSSFRRTSPRIFVVSSMGGGTGSGMVLDLCYLARRVLLEAGESKPDVEAILLAGSSRVSRDRDTVRINEYALAQNLLDLTQSEVDFTVEYDAEGESDRFTGPPVEAAYLIDQTAESLAEPRDESAMESIAELVVESASGRIGREMDRASVEGAWPVFRSLGWFSLVYPRRAMLKRAAAMLCQSMVESWLKPLSVKEGEQISRSAQAGLQASGFDPSAVSTRILDECNQCLSEPIHVLLGHCLAGLEDRIRASESPHQGAQVVDGVDQIKRILGLDPNEEAADFDEPPLWDRLLTETTNKVAASLFGPLTSTLKSALDEPGPRMVRCKRTLDGFAQYFLRLIDEQQDQVRSAQQAVLRRARELRDRASAGPVVPLRGHSIEGTMQLLDRYAKEKIECRLREQTVQVLLVLRAKLSDAARELVTVRQQLERVQSELPELIQSVDASSGYCAQSLFPGGTLALADAAQELFENFGGEWLAAMEQRVQGATLTPAGGLWAACKSAETLEEGLKRTLVAEIMTWLDENLPPTDVADAFFDRHETDPTGQKRELSAFHDWATPTMCGSSSKKSGEKPPEEFCFVCAPESSAGDALLHCVEQVAAVGSMIPVHGGEQCGFCRIAVHSSLARLLPAWMLEARRLYDQACLGRLSPEIYPHLAQK